MTDKVFVNADRSRVVPPGSVEAAMQVHREEAVKLGLLDSADKPVQERRAPTKATPQRRRTSKKK